MIPSLTCTFWETTPRAFKCFRPLIPACFRCYAGAPLYFPVWSSPVSLLSLETASGTCIYPDSLGTPVQSQPYNAAHCFMIDTDLREALEGLIPIRVYYAIQHTPGVKKINFDWFFPNVIIRKAKNNLSMDIRFISTWIHILKPWILILKHKFLKYLSKFILKFIHIYFLQEIYMSL